MRLVAKAMPRCWGYDTSAELTASAARAILKLSPQSPAFLIRYVSLGLPSPADITVVERNGIFAAGWAALGLVQHVQYPHWSASGAVGTQHGQAAVRHAQLVDYPATCHLKLDLEGLGTQGAPVYDYVSRWADEAHRAQYKVMLYDGYDDGLSLDLKSKLALVGAVDAWWSDFGPRVLPAPLTWTMKQHVQISVAATPLDPDEVLVDNVLTLMAMADTANETVDVAAGSGPRSAG